MSNKINLLLVLCTVWCITCIPRHKYRFVGDMSYLTKGNTTMLIAPVIPLLPQRYGVNSSRFEAIEQHISKKLTDMRFNVVDDTPMKRTMTEVLINSDHWCITDSGNVDIDQLKIIAGEILTAVEEKYAAGTVVFPLLTTVPVAVFNNKAVWHGREQTLQASTTLYRGTFTGLSLYILVMDRERGLVYSSYGGVQLLDTVDPCLEAIPLDQSEILAKERDIVRSVNTTFIALQDAMRKSR